VTVTSAESVPAMPFERPGIMDVPPLLMRLQAERPITRVQTPVGDPAWLVTRYADVKALLADRRFGRSHPDPERAPRITNSLVLVRADAPARGRGRRARPDAPRPHPLLHGQADGTLRPAVQAIVDREVDRVAAMPQPVDLQRSSRSRCPRW